MSKVEERTADAASDPVARQRRRRDLMRRLRLAGLAAVVLTTVAVVVVTVVDVAPPSKDDLIREAGLIGKSELRIGVKDDQPGIALRDEKTGAYSGFDIDIAYMIAAELDFTREQVRFYPIESKDRARMQARDGDGFVTVDLVVASYSITAERRAMPDVGFSAPYLRTAQSVLTRRDHPTVQSLGDLRGEKVCSLTTSTSEQLAERSGVQAYTKNKISDCVAGLRRGDFDAVTTDAAILAGFAHLYHNELRMHALGVDADERWGINVGTNSALRDLVNLALYHSKYDPRDDRWEEAFRTNLLPEERDSLPQQVAIDEQPPVDKVRIREWPWRMRALARPGAEAATW
ncbi:transporter substrate-binding domain-containing protein [Planosporangium thailandense]|uniref:Transporter substrate-binding domain-containing protein n=1 Tax=Planosporangium thailandense TaxID=765197 RepID=A0ABX0Y4Z4_9ACTN|nr:transporter substrate-binding domain-containing protein [Planosporangium thailandense]NJC73486.1 transporter substrate-binding domain-containing protein [Planosporangium thailandense]